MQARAISVTSFNGFEFVIATDKFESKYIFISPENMRGQSPFYGIKLTPMLYNNISHGKVDLQYIFASSEGEDRCSAVIENYGEAFDVRFPPVIQFDLIIPMIPQFKFNPTESDLVSLSLQENSPVISISFDVPESYDKPKISLTTFVEVIDSLQGVLESAYHKSIKNKPLKYRHLYKGYRYDQLQLMGFGPGTFTTYLRSEESVDLSGSSPMSDSLKIFDELITPVNDREKSLEVIKKFKGHVISAYKRFINAIHELDISAKFSWAEPSSATPIRKALSKQEVSPTFDLLKETEEFESEIRVLEGTLVKINKKDSSWILKTDDGTEFRGYCFDHDPSFVDGLVVNDVKYRFSCREHMERIVATERLRFEYELMEKAVINE